MSREPRRPWLVLIGLALGICVTNSFARFAYGLILPAMKAEAGWSYTQSGWLNTVNAFGYITGALLTLVLIRRVQPHVLFCIGVIATTIALLATGLNTNFVWQSVWRYFAGLFGAFSFSTAAALAALLFQSQPTKNALAIGFLFGAGGGSGIFLAGATLPVLLDWLGTSGWPWAWILIGMVSLAAMPLALWAAAQTRASGGQAGRAASLPVRQMIPEIAGYASFGLGYFVYFTFLGVWMAERGTSAAMTALTWTLLGVCLCISPFLWRRVLARFDNGVPLALILACTGLGTVLPLIIQGRVGLIASALVFGASVFMAPGCVTAFSRKNLPAESVGQAVSLFTLVFAISQTMGPVGAGWIGDQTGQIGHSLIAAAGVLVSGAAIALFQRALPARPT